MVGHFADVRINGLHFIITLETPSSQSKTVCYFTKSSVTLDWQAWRLSTESNLCWGLMMGGACTVTCHIISTSLLMHSGSAWGLHACVKAKCTCSVFSLKACTLPHFPLFLLFGWLPIHPHLIPSFPFIDKLHVSLLICGSYFITNRFSRNLTILTPRHTGPLLSLLYTPFTSYHPLFCRFFNKTSCVEAYQIQYLADKLGC